MPKIVIGNQLTEETVEGERALPKEYLTYLAAVTHRLLWCAGAEDVVVLPTPPDEEFVDYVWEMLGITRSAPAIVIPPPGRRGSELLYDDRLADRAFVDELSQLAEERSATSMYPFYFDAGIAAVEDRIGLTKAVPADEFRRSGGNDLVNSKSFFRTVAAGNNVPIPLGWSVDKIGAAAELVLSVFDSGYPAIVKQDIHGGGYGNEILARTTELQGYGAERVTAIAGREDLVAHLQASWSRYTHDGRRPVVIERYLDGSVPIYVEVHITERTIDIVGYGEMRMKPTNNGLVIPPPSADHPGFGGFLDQAIRIGGIARSVGYHGPMSIDAIIAPDNEILFNEFNGRIGGSTHIHRICEHLLGPGYLNDRAVIARSRCGWRSLGWAIKMLEQAGLAFDPQSRTGVIFAGDSHGTPGPSGQCLIVAGTSEDAMSMEESLVRALQLGQ